MAVCVPCVLFWGSLVGFLLFLLVRFTRFSDGDFTLQWLEWRGKKPEVKQQHRKLLFSGRGASLLLLTEMPPLCPPPHEKRSDYGVALALFVWRRGSQFHPPPRTFGQSSPAGKRIKGVCRKPLGAYLGPGQ
ncbi:UNVERIFIED_CONTAM: hypothetical protein K2H54_016630, partial [Gekko kuhli]